MNKGEIQSRHLSVSRAVMRACKRMDLLTYVRTNECNYCTRTLFASVRANIFSRLYRLSDNARYSRSQITDSQCIDLLFSSIFDDSHGEGSHVFFIEYLITQLGLNKRSFGIQRILKDRQEQRFSTSFLICNQLIDKSFFRKLLYRICIDWISSMYIRSNKTILLTQFPSVRPLVIGCHDGYFDFSIAITNVLSHYKRWAFANEISIETTWPII